MNGNPFGAIAVLFGLFLFGLAYNALVAWLERKRVNEPVTWLLVVGGVLVTIGGIHLLELTLPDESAAELALLAFLADGTPMVLGSVSRFLMLWRQALNYEKEQSRQP